MTVVGSMQLLPEIHRELQGCSYVCQCRMNGMFHMLSEVKYCICLDLPVIHIVAGNAMGHSSPPQIYRILGKPVVCYPIVFDLSDFYLSQDVMLLIDDIKVSWVVSHLTDSSDDVRRGLTLCSILCLSFYIKKESNLGQKMGNGQKRSP